MCLATARFDKSGQSDMEYSKKLEMLQKELNLAIFQA